MAFAVGRAPPAVEPITTNWINRWRIAQELANICGNVSNNSPNLVMLAAKLHEAIVELAIEHDWRLVVLFGSTAREGTGRDLDIAVLPKGDVDLFTQGGWQQQLEAISTPKPVDLVLVTDGLSPVLRFEIFHSGQCLFENEDGLFDREQDRAFFLYADTEWLRLATSEALRERD